MSVKKFSRYNYFKGLSHRLLLLCAIIYLLDFLMFGKLTDLFSLQPSLIANKMEFWRIFTFPFVPGSIEGVFLFVFTFFFIGPKLESKLRKNFFPIILIFLIFLQGTITTLIFWQSNFIFAGMEAISFFILVLFTFINLNKKITFWGFKPVKSIMLVALLSITWISAVAIHSTLSGNEILLKASTSLIFGIITGGITYLQTEFYKRSSKIKENLKKNLTRKKFDNALYDEESPAFVIKNETKIQNQNQNQTDEDLNHPQYKFIFSEQKLNDILDKINEKGKESLTNDEIQYLKDYSENL